jgi:hypothetical protein
MAPFVGTTSAAGADGDGVITLFLGLLVGACGIAGLRSQQGKAAKIAETIGLVVAASVIGCYDVATISDAAGDVPELDKSAGVRLTPVVGLLAAGLRPALGRLLGHGHEVNVHWSHAAPR